MNNVCKFNQYIKGNCS